MKKIALIIATLLLSTGAFAQEWVFGILGGGNIAKIQEEGYVDIGTGDPVKGSDNKVLAGGFIGGLVQYDFDNWGLRSEVYYSQQGTRISLAIPDLLVGTITVTTSRRSNNINVPVLAYLKLFEDRLSIMAGPTFGFCVGGTDYFGNINSTTIIPEKLIWASTGFNVFDVQATIGAEFMFIDSVGIMARYNHGFLNVFKGDGMAIAPYGKNRTIQIGLVYKFGR